MKSASLSAASMASGAKSGRAFYARLLAVPRMLVRLAQRQADALPAIALAEAGDTDGAAELLARARARKT